MAKAQERAMRGLKKPAKAPEAQAAFFAMRRIGLESMLRRA